MYDNTDRLKNLNQIKYAQFFFIVYTRDADDGHIEFSTFREIKTDFETKISILGDTVYSYSKRQLEFINKINNSGGFLSQMDNFYHRLTGADKRSFLSRVLVKSTR